MADLRCLDCNCLASMHGADGCFTLNLSPTSPTMAHRCKCKKTNITVLTAYKEKYELPANDEFNILKNELANVRNQALMLGTALSVIGNLSDKDFSENERKELVEDMQNLRNKINKIMNDQPSDGYYY